MTKVLIVGQAPSRTSDPSLPLSGRTGATLAGWCGLTQEQFRERFWLANASYFWLGRTVGGGDVQPRGIPYRRRLQNLLDGHAAEYRVVLLGSAVRRLLFGAYVVPPYRFHQVGVLAGDRVVAWAPHPSQVSRRWNDPANVEEARLFFRSLV